MSFDQLQQDWVYTPHPPPDCSTRLYYFEVDNSFGFKDEGRTWYRLSCSYWFGDWIEANGSPDQWRAYGSPHRAIYIVRDDFFTFIQLRWR